MSDAIQKEVATQEDLNLWFTISAQLETLKIQEMELRKKIFASYFTKPKEGTNSVPLSQGWVLKGQYVINRKPDIAALDVLRKDFTKMGIAVETLIRNKPELATAEYRKLTDAQRNEFDKALVIQIGAPALEIVKPRRSA